MEDEAEATVSASAETETADAASVEVENSAPSLTGDPACVEAEHNVPEDSGVAGVVLPTENGSHFQEVFEDKSDNPKDGPVGTLDDAQRFFDEGRAALRSGDYEQAVEDLSRALEIRTRQYGELAFECAFTYYKYGCALLYKAQDESDPLGGVKNTADPSAPSAGETAEEGKDEEDELEEEEESDLEMAWKVLDVARVIYEKQQSHSIEEVDVITALADVSLEKEDFELCFRDYTRALEILEGLVEPDDRGISELCFKLSLALQLGYKPKDALRYCQRAVSVCEARLSRLRNDVAIIKGLVDPKGKSVACNGLPKDALQQSTVELSLDAPAAAAQAMSCQKEVEEIKEIELLLDDLKEKVLELQDMASGPSLLESLKETNPGAMNSIKQVLDVTSQLVAHGGGGGSSSHRQPDSGFDAPSVLASAAPVQHLGVVGRGVKRATPVLVSNTANGHESTVKKRSLDDMMTRGGAGVSQTGFGADSQIGFGTTNPEQEGGAS